MSHDEQQGGPTARDVVEARGEADDAETPPERVRARDLLKAGDLTTTETASSRFGERVMRRHMVRPAGNSRRLWEKVDGEDPWDLPKAAVPDKQRGVYAAGRFVRIDREEARKKGKPGEDSHIPDWARAAQKAREAARAKPTDAPAPKPTAEKKEQTPQEAAAALERLVASRNAQHKAEAARKAAEAAEEAARPKHPVHGTPKGRSTGKRASLSKAGRIRTSRGGHLGPEVVEKEKAPQIPPEQRRYAAGRAPPKPRGPAKDIPLEMRRPPRVDRDAGQAQPDVPLEQRRYAAGRAPPKRTKVKDIPIEQRRPPRIDRETGEQVNVPVPPEQRRYAAGRAPPKPRGPAKDLPVEARRPPRIGEDGQVIPHEPAPSADPPEAPVDRTPPKPAPPPKPEPPRTMPKAGGGGLDDLFGVAATEGRVRIKRAKKKAPEPDDEETS